MTGHDQAIEATVFVGDKLFSCGKDGRINKYLLNGNLESTWTHPLLKPFVGMIGYGQHLLAANLEPSIHLYSTEPTVLEVK